MIERLDVSRETLDKLKHFESLVIKWTSKINLIAKGTVNDVWDRHILDSVQIWESAPEAADIVIYMLEIGEEPTQQFGADTIIVRSKVDQPQDGVFGVSGKTGAGIDKLIAHIETDLRNKSARVGVAMRERHRIALLQGCDALNTAIGMMDSGIGMSDIIAEEIRTAVRATESLTGRVDVEDLLDVIFSSFCIGK